MAHLDRPKVRAMKWDQKTAHECWCVDAAQDVARLEYRNTLNTFRDQHRYPLATARLIAWRAYCRDFEYQLVIRSF
jgi:hypothetical protein